MNNQTLWANYAAGIAKAAGLGAAPDNLILTGTSEVANLAEKSTMLPSVPTVDQALFQIYSLGDTLVHDKFVYDSAESSFFNNYATYIDNLTPKGAQPPSPTDTAIIKGIKVKLEAANTTWTNDFTKAAAAWKTQSALLPDRYPTFQEFLNDTPWGQTINTDQNAVTAQNSALSTIMTKVYGQDYVAIQNAKTVVEAVRAAKTGSTVSSTAEMLVQATSGKLVVPTYNPSDLDQFSTWVDGIITAHTPTAPSQQAISFNAATGAGSSAWSNSSYYSHTQFNGGWWFFRSGSSVTHRGSSSTVNTSSSEFSVTFGFDGIQTIDVARGPWFDSSLMYDYPGQELSSPTQLIVGMYPQIELKMDTESYASAKSAYNSSAGFGVGCWWVSSSTQKSSSSANFSAKWDSSSNSLTISPIGVQPVILGMIVNENRASGAVNNPSKAA